LLLLLLLFGALQGYYRRGDAYFMLGKFKDAIKDLKTVSVLQAAGLVLVQQQWTFSAAAATAGARLAQQQVWCMQQRELAWSSLQEAGLAEPAVGACYSSRAGMSHRQAVWRRCSAVANAAVVGRVEREWQESEHKHCHVG
jgi:hypothetical protein